MPADGASSIHPYAQAPTDNLRGTMNLGDDAGRLAAEARACVLIDRQLTDADWSVQDCRSLNLFAAHQGVARREATMATGHGRADYLLYVDQRVVGVRRSPKILPCRVSSGSPRCTPKGYRRMSGWRPRPRTAGSPSSSRPVAPRPTSPTASTPSRGPAESSTSRRRPPSPRPGEGRTRSTPPGEARAPLRPAQIEAINGVELGLRPHRRDRLVALAKHALTCGNTVPDR